MFNRSEIKVYLLFFLLIFSAYFNSFWINFFWDDKALVIDNPLIKDIANVGEIFLQPLSAHNSNFYRPAQTLSYMLDFLLFKFDYRGYHLTNILLHFLVVVLFYKTLLLFGGKRTVAFFAALLYGLSPLWVESVSYISGRADMLMAVFLLTSFIAFLKGRLGLAYLSYLAGLFSKEPALIFPLALVFYISFFQEKEKRKLLPVIIFFALSGLYLIFRFNACAFSLPENTAHPLFTRLALSAAAFPGYISMVFLPVGQHMSHYLRAPAYLWDGRVLLAFLLIFMIFRGIKYFLKEDRGIAFFLGWFLIMLLPYSGLFPLNAYFSEHFIYSGAIGIFAALVYFLNKACPKKVFIAVLCGYGLFFLLATIKYNFIWQDPVKLYQRIIKLSPHSDGAWNNLGLLYLERGDAALAEKLFSEAARLNPEGAEAVLNLARLHYLKGDLSRAIELAKEAADKNPRSFIAYDYLGVFCLKSGERPLAEQYFRKALQLNSRFVPLWKDLYLFYKTCGRKKEADEVLREIKKRGARIFNEISRGEDSQENP